MEKRKTIYDVSKIFPIFRWCRCEKCKEEFKLEFCYKILMYRTYHTVVAYVCNKCAKDKYEADEYMCKRRGGKNE